MPSYRYFREDLENLNRQYDKKQSLLYLPLREISTNRNPLVGEILLHPTRESLDYALLLLSENIQTKKIDCILSTIVKLQNQKKHSVNYGGWPKYLESTYFRASGKYWKFDRNWTEFIGWGLLEILFNDVYRTRLNPNLISAITSSVTHAALAIKQRNVSHIYTNICVVGTCITLLVGKMLDIKYLYQHGLNSLDEIHMNAINCNCFAEYNSPNYTLITLKALYYLKSIVEKNFDYEKTLVKKINELYYVAWKEIAYHFHPTTQEWAGPHSRGYSTLLNSRIANFIKYITKDSNDLEKKDSALLDRKSNALKPPNNLQDFFMGIDQPRMITREITYRNPPQILRTYLTPTFTIGTVNYSDFWHQRNSLIGYWGTAEDTNYLRLRCLHNGQDFSPAQFFSVQDEGRILGGINFATDVGKCNPYLPKSKLHKLGFLTYDLRIRFEFGSTSRIPNIQILKQSDLLLTLKIDNMYFNFSIPYARFNSHELKWSISKDNNTLNLDVVIYSGKIRLIDFSSLNLAMVSFFLRMSNDLFSLDNELIKIQTMNKMLILSSENLLLSFTKTPDTLRNLRASFSSELQTNSCIFRDKLMLF